MNRAHTPLLDADAPGEPAAEPAATLRGLPDTVTLACVHCGEPTPCAPTTDPEQVFCCAGCRGAYQLIQGWGLADFYALRDQMKQTGAAQPAGMFTRYEQFDTPEFLGLSTPQPQADGLCTTELAVQGLHCAACAWLIEKAAAMEPGVRLARIKMSDHTARFVFDPQTTQLSRVARLLDRLGYRLIPLDRGRDTHLQHENRRLLIQIAIAGFLAANAMWIAVALYAGQFSGLAAEHGYFLGLVGTALGVAAVVGPGRTFFVGAVASLKTRVPHMDLPVALGLTAGSVMGTTNAILGRGHVYFDSLATLVFLLLIGRWIQFRQQRQAARAVDLMLRITPRHANLVDETGQTSLVLVDRLSSGDMLRVLPGESLPADGIVMEGTTEIDRSLLTGESRPVTARAGDAVAAGTVNLVSPIRVQVTATGRETRIGQVMQSIEAAASERTPIVQLADRIGGVFVLVVTSLALLTLLLWLPAGLNAATAHATSLLIVACPCALALATPLAIAVGLGRAAKLGVLIRDGQALQWLAKPGQIWFDKTGTLTEGKQRVSHFRGDLAALRLAAGVERECQHPVARAIVSEAQRQRLAPVEPSALSSAGSGGITGHAAGQAIVVGNAAWLQMQQVSLTDDFASAADELLECGESPIFIAVDQRVQAVLGISDPLRAGAAQLMRQLRASGWQVGLLSGDHALIARRVGQQLDLEPEQCLGDLAPEDKVRIIRQARQAGRVRVMVGDGANDAAALAAADVGIAVRGGAEVSLQAAPVFVGSGRLASVLHLLRGSRRVTRLIYLSFAISLAYNVVAVVLAMAGWISPLVAAILMPLSSISVLAVTLACPTFVDEADCSEESTLPGQELAS